MILLRVMDGLLGVLCARFLCWGIGVWLLMAPMEGSLCSV